MSIMATKTAWKVLKGIPEGSILKGFTIDPYSNCLFLWVQHDSFEPVDIHSVAPMLETEFVRIV